MAGRDTPPITARGTFVRVGWRRPRVWLLVSLSLLALLLPPFARSEPSAHDGSGALFETSERCFACHNGLSTPTGEDISIGVNWRATMMANSSRDPYWQAAVRRETIEHPTAAAAIEDECSICHMPMARYEAMVDHRESEVFSLLPFDSEDPAGRLAADGVSCTICHQIESQGLGSKESFVGRFKIDENRAEANRKIYGPFEIDAGRTKIMRSSAGFQPAEGKHIQDSELCATCHTLYTKALGPQGDVIGELPEQTPYQEWLHSDFREEKSCQNCHMPVVDGETPIASVLGKPREGMSRHVFIGGNFFMLRMLNRYRTELAVTALPEELEASAARTIAHLQAEAAEIAITRVELRGNRLQAEVAVTNLGGHKLPTAYPSRRAWLHLVVRQANNEVVFESGRLDAKGLIQGNDNDADPKKYEPHYSEIAAGDQVQIYESVMSDSSGAPTTGLLAGIGYLKDNRLLPRGFDKPTAPEDISVKGRAAEDQNFQGGSDQILYSVPVDPATGPFQIEAELLYQPISYRWAENLRAYDAAETRRFTSYYDAMAPASGAMLARETARSQ